MPGRFSRGAVNHGNGRGRAYDAKAVGVAHTTVVATSTTIHQPTATTSAKILYEEYHPYGTSAYRAAASGLEVAKRYRFNGKERDDETGLYYYGARYYAAWLARWTSADPLGIGADGPGVYNYTRGSPVMMNDPNGTTPTLYGTDGKPIDVNNLDVPKVPDGAPSFEYGGRTVTMTGPWAAPAQEPLKGSPKPKPRLPAMKEGMPGTVEDAKEELDEAAPQGEGGAPASDGNYGVSGAGTTPEETDALSGRTSGDYVAAAGMVAIVAAPAMLVYGSGMLLLEVAGLFTTGSHDDPNSFAGSPVGIAGLGGKSASLLGAPATSGSNWQGRGPYNDPWTPINEVANDPRVVPQATGGCTAACGEMVIGKPGTAGQLASEMKLGTGGTNPRNLARAMDVVDAPNQYIADVTGPLNRKGVAQASSKGPWVAGMDQNIAKTGARHAIVIDGVNAQGRVMVRDPIGQRSYEMSMKDFKNFYSGLGVFRW